MTGRAFLKPIFDLAQQTIIGDIIKGLRLETAMFDTAHNL
jgi:hypothetical protein